ncbi:MAG: glycoside hydrolase family 18 protein [Opitutaceae bacterium]
MTLFYKSLLLLLITIVSAAASELHTVGYSAWWQTADSTYRNGPFAAQASYLDEIVYFGEFQFDASGNIVTAAGGNIVVESSPGVWNWNVSNTRTTNTQDVFNKVFEVSPTTKVTFTIGGWGNSQNFAIFSDSNDSNGDKALNAATQVRAILDLSSGRMHGVDLDWEDGDGVSDTMAGNEDAYTNLTAAIRAVLQADEQLTVAIQNNRYSSGVAVIHNIDVLRPFTYDAPEFDGNHTSLLAAQTIIGNWLARGIPANKLGVGVGFFARPLVNPWSNSDTYTSLDHTYRVNNGTWLPDNLTEYLGWGFDGVDSVEAKAAWCKAQGLHSLYIWELGDDNRSTDTDTNGLSHYLILTETVAASAADPNNAIEIINSAFDLSAKELTLTWNSQIGEAYNIEASNTLAPGSWVNVVTSLNATDGNEMIHTVNDLGMTNQPKRFYRVGKD